MKTSVLFICSMFLITSLNSGIGNKFTETPSRSIENPQLTDAFIKYGNHPNHWSPLNYALEKEDFKSALILLNYTGDINRRDDRWLPLDRLVNKSTNALSIEQEEMYRIFFEMNAQNSHGLDSRVLIFHKVANFGSFEFVNYLLLQGIDLSDNKGYPFLGAVSSGNETLVRHLISLGLDIRKVQGTLNTAIASHNLELIKYVWEELDQRPASGWGNPLNVAIQHQDLGVFIYLLEVGLSPNEPEGQVLKRALTLPENTDEEKEYKKTVVELLILNGAKY